MKFNQLEQGKVYVTDVRYPGYIFKCVGNCTAIPFTYNNFQTYFPSGSLSADHNRSFSDYREATYEEALRWEACLEAERIVPMPEINYSIY